MNQALYIFLGLVAGIFGGAFGKGMSGYPWPRLSAWGFLSAA